jgi:hypothetical protein
MSIRRGEIYLARLFEFPHEDEQAVDKERPVLILQNWESSSPSFSPDRIACRQSKNESVVFSNFYFPIHRTDH